MFVKFLSKIRGAPAISQPLLPINTAIEMAKREWIYACKIYNMATEKELIDYASYLIKANENRYMYLLRQAKQDKLKTAHISLEPYDVKMKITEEI